MLRMSSAVFTYLLIPNDSAEAAETMEHHSFCGLSSLFFWLRTQELVGSPVEYIDTEMRKVRYLR